eukprot:TRINITY_DN18747_c0_g1_i2.p1 TRINITY_DN18747_c0_g1~~TRINITY_DN18747_c0_g1_i2.p1  ORF type:complete len:309 (+),score=86.50 TRINITY_DN18747_c0_g1_i2:156-1082(+)
MVLRSKTLQTDVKEQDNNSSEEENPRTIQYVQAVTKERGKKPYEDERKHLVEENVTVNSAVSKLKKSAEHGHFASMPVKKRVVKAKRKEETTTTSSLFKASNEEPSKQRTQSSKELAQTIKSLLEENGIALAKLIEQKVVKKRIKDGEVKKVIAIADLVNVLEKAIKISKSDLENLFRPILELGKNCIVVSNLISFLGMQIPDDSSEGEQESFEELNKKIPQNDSDSDEELLEVIGKLTEESKGILASLISYMTKANKDLLTIFKKGVYQQTIAMADGEMILDAINSKDFYATPVSYTHLTLPTICSV